MAVYIDVMFMREFIFDALLLTVTAWMAKMKWTWWKIGLAAILGASYTIALFFPQLSILFHFGFKVLTSVLMLLIAFGYGALKQFIKVFIMFYLISFLAGGVTTGLYYMLLPSANSFWKSVLLMNNGFYSVIQTSFIYLVIGFCIATFLVVKAVEVKKKQKLIEHNLVNVTILIERQELSCMALIDTGNQLYDPLSRTPVMIVEAGLVATLFPQLIAALKVDKDSSYPLSQLSDEQLGTWQTKIKIIPFRSVNKDGQYIVAIKPESLTFIHNDELISTKRVLLGLDYGQLHAERQYQAILHPALLSSEG